MHGVNERQFSGSEHKAERQSSRVMRVGAVQPPFRP
jgi:hypothetical protein